MVGCRPFPKSEQGKLLIDQINDFVNRKFHLTGPDVIKAFEAAAARELNIGNKPIEPDTFGQYLSIATFGKVLSAYRDYKKEEPKLRLPHYENELQRPHTPITPKEAFELCHEKSKLEDPQLHLLPLTAAYRYMEKEGLVKSEKNRVCNIMVKWLGRTQQMEITAHEKSVIDYFSA